MVTAIELSQHILKQAFGIPKHRIPWTWRKRLFDRFHTLLGDRLGRHNSATLPWNWIK